MREGLANQPVQKFNEEEMIGLFEWALWNPSNSELHCSDGLEDFFGFAEGSLLNFEDIRACFEGNSKRKFDEVCSTLWQSGKRFHIRLLFLGQDIQVQGSLLNKRGGNSPANFIFIWNLNKTDGSVLVESESSSIKAISEAPLPSEYRDLRYFIKSMPAPVWIA